MAASDPILAVSRVFADLADDGGAAADSLATINSILKTSLNRTMLRFGKAMNDSVKSIQAFNVGLKTASKRVSTSVTQKQAARMGAASQASEAIHRTKVYYQNQQQTKSTNKTNDIESAFDDLIDAIRSPLIVAVEKVGGNLLNLGNVLSNIIQTFLALKSINIASQTKSIANDTKQAFSVMFDESHKASGVFTNPPYIKPSEPEKPMTNKEQRINKATNAYLQQTEILFARLKDVNSEIEDSASLLKMFGGSLGDTSKEQARFAEFTKRRDALINMAGSLNKRKDIDVAEAKTTRLGDVGDMLKGIDFTNVKTRILQFAAALKVSTVALTTGFAAAIGYVVYKMYDFGKNAFPRLINYLQKPLQTVYEFVTGPLNQAFSKITSFVSTLNPAYGEQANRALEDLSAVIGKIVLPIFNAMLSVLKVFTSTLHQNAGMFTDTIKTFAKLLANAGSIIIGNFFKLLEQSQPILQALTEAFERAIPVINNSLMKLFKEIQKHIPTFIQAIDSLGMMLEMYLKQKLQEFANEAALASKAAQNQARAMELFGNEAMTLSMAFNNLGYYLADFMLQLEAVIIELMNMANKIVGRPQEGGIIGTLDVAGKVDERNLNIGQKAGAGLRKWIAGLFGAEDMPWVAKQPKPVAGEGQFDLNAVDGGDFGPQPDFQEGFAAKGAAFQEIGQLGKNLAAASFGIGADAIPAQQLNQLQQINANGQAMLQNQNRFNGAAPVQGVR